MATNIDLKIQNLMMGNFEDIPEQNSSLVRLFLSSTTIGMYAQHLRCFNIFEKNF